MSGRSDWCAHGNCPACRYAACSCDCGHDIGSTVGVFSAKSNTSATRIEAQMKTAPTGALTPNAGASPTIGASTNA